VLLEQVGLSDALESTVTYQLNIVGDGISKGGHALLAHSELLKRVITAAFDAPSSKVIYIIHPPSTKKNLPLLKISSSFSLSLSLCEYIYFGLQEMQFFVFGFVSTKWKNMSVEYFFSLIGFLLLWFFELQ
jgi:hypothetical protein